jgi:hypothetical protein
VRGIVGAGTIAFAVVLAAGSGAAAAPARRTPLTVIGDSVAASLQYPSAERYLQRTFRLDLDVKVCRRLVAPSCPYHGVQAPSALEAIQARHASISPAVVVDVGYNDAASTYADDLDRVMHALVGTGAARVVWLTLRRYGSMRRARINRTIRAARARWPELQVADWSRWSHGHSSWFVSDGIHLDRLGALGLARLIRRAVLASP